MAMSICEAEFYMLFDRMVQDIKGHVAVINPMRSFPSVGARLYYANLEAA